MYSDSKATKQGGEKRDFPSQLAMGQLEKFQFLL